MVKIEVLRVKKSYAQKNLYVFYYYHEIKRTDVKEFVCRAHFMDPNSLTSAVQLNTSQVQRAA